MTYKALGILTQSSWITSDYSGGNLECYLVLFLRLTNRVNFPVEVNSDYFLTLFHKTEN